MTAVTRLNKALLFTLLFVLLYGSAVTAVGRIGGRGQIMGRQTVQVIIETHGTKETQYAGGYRCLLEQYEAW